ISGGGRCNVTNRTVTSADFAGGSPHVVKRILDAFPACKAVKFFRELGVTLHEEHDGKLFPDTNKARTVLDALLTEAARLNVRILTGHRATDLRQTETDFQVDAADTTYTAPLVVLAAGGKSLPKTGSDGSGYRLAEKLGHTIIPTTPALVPLVLEGDFHEPLSGISHPVELTLRAEGAKPLRVTGDMPWTRFGLSGPAVLDVSRHWHRAQFKNRPPVLTANFIPGHDAPAADRRLLDFGVARPKAQLRSAVASLLPNRVADAVLKALNLHAETPMSQLTKDDRRRLAQSLVNWPVPVIESRGYQYAEVTAGGVPLTEVDPRTLASRKCKDLHLVGEILDVDGRLGGFNFQWSWSTAHTAAAALAPRLQPRAPKPS
ncbi:MAG: aminoacetone oxidase family FAD-binding enzyme, partial [Planctomycetes bacterium]|nr:aminoacetone oxidase family FAD-binding enzyme [Planctomycetota bacterium]